MFTTISIDPDIMSGTPVFAGTRVPIKNLFDNIESGSSIEAFLRSYPTVTREQVISLLEYSRRLVLSSKFESHEVAA